MTKVQNNIKHTLEQEIQKNSWNALWLGYVCFANSLLAERVWQGKVGGLPPGGLDGEDIVETVFVKIFDNTLNCEIGVEFEAFIKQSIKATVSHLAISKENVLTVSQFFESKDAIRVCNMLDFASYPEKCQYKMFPSKMFNLTAEQIISEFLQFIKKDACLTKIAKIFVFNGVVFEECFKEIYDSAGLMKCLISNGYIDQKGEVQNEFWILGSSSQMKLDEKFNSQKRVIFLIIARSVMIEKPRDIAEWMNMDIRVIYNITKKMKRYLLSFKNKMKCSNGGDDDEK